MKFPVYALVLACAALLAGAAAVPPPVPAPATPAAPAPPPPPAAADYTTQMSEPALLPEYDPATAPPPMYAAAPGDQGGIRQCIGTDGVPIFTDRRCEDLQATPYQPPSAQSGSHLPPGQLRVRSCARNQDDLLAGVRAALESHDANRLADYYHWSGMGTVEGYRLMDRLDAFSARPIVDVQLVRGAAPEADPYAEPFSYTPPLLPPPEALGGNGEPVGTVPAAPHRPRRALLLRVDQMRSDTDAAATITYFHLLTNAGCWWMRF